MIRKLRNIGFFSQSVLVLFMIALMVIMLYPLLHVIFSSLSNASLLLKHQGVLLKPLGFTLQAYEAVFENRMILTGYRNTIIVVLVSVPLNIVLTAFAAYFLSLKNVLLQKYVMLFIIFTMFFGGGMIPFYFVVKNLHIDDTLLAIILPSAISTFNVIIMKTSFSSIPFSLRESAKIDGANDFYILFNIIMPLSLPVIAVMVLYYTVGHWNSWFNAMLFIRDRTLYPLQLVLKEILIQNDVSSMTNGFSQMEQEGVSETIKYAIIVVAFLPMLCVYPFLQKYFVKGVMIGAVKE